MNKEILIAAAANKYYFRTLLNRFGADLLQYLPLWETTGTVAADISGNGRDGAYNAPTTLAGGVSRHNRACPLLATRAINITSAALSAALNGAEGAFGSWGKVNAGGWSDGLGHYLGRLMIDTSNRVMVYWGPTAYAIVATYTAGGTADSVGYPCNYSGWFHWMISWSKANERMRFWVNGVPVVERLTLGDWAGGTLSTSYTRLGGSDLSSNVFPGLLSDCVILGREPTRAEARALAAGGTAIAIIGDSISAPSGGILKWPYAICDTVYGGGAAAINHAVSGQSIAGHLATQAAACASDEAGAIVLALGRNDNDAGDMGALQATVETNIDTLRASNPSAVLYYMNVLPAWTDTGGGTAIALDNIRGAVAAACLAKGVTCWDTLTDPWITAADTTDGTHPNQAGHDKITARVAARLP